MGDWVDAEPLAGFRAWLQERQYVRPYHWYYRGNHLREYRIRTETVAELLGLGSPSPSSLAAGAPPRLLDVGCGDGRFLADVAPYTNAWGVDCSARALGFAGRLVPKARFAVARADALCFPDASFDAVTLLDVIEHVPDRVERAVLREARRVLRPGGRLVISTNSDCTLAEWKHFRHYALPRFRALFDELEDLRVVGLIGPYFPALRVLLHIPGAEYLVRHRLRRCAPENAYVIVGAATMPRLRRTERD